MRQFAPATTSFALTDRNRLGRTGSQSLHLRSSAGSTADRSATSCIRSRSKNARESGLDVRLIDIQVRERGIIGRHRFVRHTGLPEPARVEGTTVVSIRDILLDHGPVLRCSFSVFTKPQHHRSVVASRFSDAQDWHLEISAVMNNVFADRRAAKLRISHRLPPDLIHAAHAPVKFGDLPLVDVGTEIRIVKLPDGLRRLLSCGSRSIRG